MNKPLTKNEQYVLQVIKENPGCQNEEMKLLEAVYLRQGWNESNSLYWNLTRVMHPETVARARRKLHEYGLIEYSPNALRRRTKRFRDETERHSDYMDRAADIVSRKITVKEIDGELVTVLE